MNYMHFALQKLYILPSVLEAMDQREKALVYASIDLRTKQEKKEAARLKT